MCVWWGTGLPTKSWPGWWITVWWWILWYDELYLFHPHLSEPPNPLIHSLTVRTIGNVDHWYNNLTILSQLPGAVAFGQLRDCWRSEPSTQYAIQPLHSTLPAEQARCSECGQLWKAHPICVPWAEDKAPRHKVRISVALWEWLWRLCGLVTLPESLGLADSIIQPFALSMLVPLLMEYFQLI